jgi:hypothetical protein
MEQNAASPVKNADITSALASWGMGSSSGAPSGMGGAGAGEVAGEGDGSVSGGTRDGDAPVSATMLMSTPQVRCPEMGVRGVRWWCVMACRVLFHSLNGVKRRRRCTATPLLCAAAVVGWGGARLGVGVGCTCRLGFVILLVIDRGAFAVAPQYRPYAAPTVFYGNGSAGSQSGTQGGAGLLTGEEKIAEMMRVVEVLTSDRDRMARELEEVQAEKVGQRNARAGARHVHHPLHAKWHGAEGRVGSCVLCGACCCAVALIELLPGLCVCVLAGVHGVPAA